MGIVSNTDSEDNGNDVDSTDDMGSDVHTDNAGNSPHNLDMSHMAIVVCPCKMPPLHFS